MDPIPHGLAELEKRYGKLQIDTDPRGGYRIISPIGWESANMLLMTDLPGLPGRKLYIHRAMRQPLYNAMSAAYVVAPGYSIKTIGCFNPRFKKTVRSELSVHTWGLAVDINAATNPLGGETDMPDAFIHAFKSEGFVWGGDFQHTKDPMHFQLVSGY